MADFDIQKFDIRSLPDVGSIQDELLVFWCTNCGYLHREVFFWNLDLDDNEITVDYPKITIHCTHCAYPLIVTTSDAFEDEELFRTFVVGKAAYELRKKIQRFDNLADHINITAKTGKHLGEAPNFFLPPLESLIKLLSNSQLFIHFMSYRISEQFIGVLKSAWSRGVNVKGVVTGLNPHKPYDKRLIEELGLGIESSRPHGFDVRISSLASNQGSHTKLIIIDGLIAIDGSAFDKFFMAQCSRRS